MPAAAAAVLALLLALARCLLLAGWAGLLSCLATTPTQNLGPTGVTQAEDGRMSAYCWLCCVQLPRARIRHCNHSKQLLPTHVLHLLCLKLGGGKLCRSKACCELLRCLRGFMQCLLTTTRLYHFALTLSKALSPGGSSMLRM